jgi:hypothetical protein
MLDPETNNNDDFPTKRDYLILGFAIGLFAWYIYSIALHSFCLQYATF